MFNSTVLDVAVGLTFVYLALALLCTALNEWWSRQLGLRGKVLKDGIHSLLGAGPEGNDLTQAFYRSPLIEAITGSGEHPSYISSQLFAQALVGALKALKATEPPAVAGAGDPTVQSLVEQMKDGPTKRALQTILLGAGTTVDAAIARISAWFDDSMDRVSGWYKRKIQFVTLIMAILVTVVANADTLRIVNQLWTNPTLRASVVARAQERAKQAPPVDMSYKDSSPEPTEPATASATAEANGGKPILTAGEKEALGGLLTWSPEFSEFNKLVAESERSDYYKSQRNADGMAEVRNCLEAKETVELDPCTRYGPTPDASCIPAQKKVADADCAKTIAVVEKSGADSTLHAWVMLEHPRILLTWLYWLVPLRIVGWVITVYAISLGAPFWFGVLQKLVNIRSAGDAPDEKVPGIVRP